MEIIREASHGKTRCQQSARRVDTARARLLRRSDALTQTFSGDRRLRLGRRDRARLAVDVDKDRADDGAVERLRTLQKENAIDAQKAHATRNSVSGVDHDARR